jgi:hypothetical protein
VEAPPKMREDGFCQHWSYLTVADACHSSLVLFKEFWLLRYGWELPLNVLDLSFAKVEEVVHPW